MAALKQTADGRRRFTKTEKIKVLQYLEAKDFNVKKTTEKYGISRETINVWRKTLGNEAFGIKPRVDIALKKKNEVVLLEASQVKLERLKLTASAKATQMIIDRLSDEEVSNNIETKVLVQIASLFKQEAPIDAPREIDILRQKLEQFDLRKKMSNEATDVVCID